MLSRNLLITFALVGMTSATPRPIALNYDDVVLLNADGSSTVVKENEYTALVSRGLLQPAPQAPSLDSRDARKTKHRRCDESNEVQVTSDATFLNWDVPMSPVISAQGGGAQVSVTAGYEISNSLSVGVGVEASLIKDILSISMTVEYSQSWTTTQEQSLFYNVPDGQFGVIVSQPLVRRVEGNYLSGCTDSWDKKSFVSDTYSSRQFGNLNWVQGVIRLCNSSSYPIPYCIGDGAHA
ncbi:hypothetical protein B0O99DRAFT_607673 [Bisporella sp. PMI_857]|nr:hypothetical protein B0O99DRAFT_607673 [Bisporella sp. PMI_857]